MKSIQSGYWPILATFLATAMRATALAQVPEPGIFASAGVAFDVDGTVTKFTPGLVGTVSLGKDLQTLGLRIGLDVFTLDDHNERRGSSVFFVADGHERISDSVRVGFLAGGLLERGASPLTNPGILLGAEAAIALPRHSFVIVPDVRISLFPLAGTADWHGYAILRSGVSIRWAM
jgi:hypothetical protein